MRLLTTISLCAMLNAPPGPWRSLQVPRRVYMSVQLLGARELLLADQASCFCRNIAVVHWRRGRRGRTLVLVDGEVAL